MAVLKWKRANQNKQRKVDWFHLFRFEQLHGDSGPFSAAASFV